MHAPSCPVEDVNQVVLRWFHNKADRWLRVIDIGLQGFLKIVFADGQHTGWYSIMVKGRGANTEP